MEHLLRQTLLQCAASFAAADGCAVSTVGRRCKNDSRFFRRLGDIRQSFTARTYDEVMAWLNENWPATSEKPFELHQWAREAARAAQPAVQA